MLDCYAQYVNTNNIMKRSDDYFPEINLHPIEFGRVNCRPFRFSFEATNDDDFALLVSLSPFYGKDV